MRPAHIITAASCILLLASTGCAPGVQSRSSVHLVPPFSSVVEFHADPITNYSRTYHIDEAQLRQILETYHVVSEERWLHHYSHMTLIDRTGTISLKDQTVVRWLVRAAGLATLTFPDNKVIYLAKDITP